MILSELSKNMTGKIIKINIDNKTRLYDLGIIEGEIIKLVHTSFFFLTRKPFLINGTVFAIRKEDSDLIEIEAIDNEN